VVPRYLVWFSVAGWVFGGCIIDKDDVCGAGQVKSSERFAGCMCEPGFVPNADGVGCHACASDEEVRGGQCIPMRADAGAAQTGDDAGPADGTRGQDVACDGPDDCAAYDATYCQMLQAPYICLVQGCVSGEHRCAGDRVCCDWSDLPLLAPTNGLCIPLSGCVSPGKVVTQ